MIGAFKHLVKSKLSYVGKLKFEEIFQEDKWFLENNRSKNKTRPK